MVPKLFYVAYLVGAVRSYDEEVARLLNLFADVSYCGDGAHPPDGSALNSIESWSCPPCVAATATATAGIVKSVAFFGNASRQTFGFVGVSSGWPEQRIVVSFRGSVLQQNYDDDYDDLLSPYQFGGRVARGLYLSYASMASSMFDAVASLRSKFRSVQKIMVTGHSLGAAQAVYCGHALAAAYPDMEVAVYSFGLPRPGDFQHAQRLNEVGNLHITAVIHRGDTVPQCGIRGPPCESELAKGYHQVFDVVWYPDGLAPQVPSTAWVQCGRTGEDPHCQNSVPQSELNWADHDVYLGHAMFCCDGTVWARGMVDAPTGCKFPFTKVSASLRTAKSQVRGETLRIFE